MGKKGTWLSAVKKAFSTSKDPAEQNHKDPSSKYLFSKDGRSKEAVLQEKKSFKERNRWSFRRSTRALQPADQLHLHPGNDINQYEELQNRSGQTGEATYLSSNGHLGFEKGYVHNHHQNKQALAVAVATAAAAEAAVAAAAQAVSQVVKLTGATRSGCNSNNNTPRSTINERRRSRQELAAIRIQAAFRAYLARRTLRTLKGLARLQALAQGRVGRRQTTATMRCMQALVRAQAAVRGCRTTRLGDDTHAIGETTLLQPTWEQFENHRNVAVPIDMNEKGTQNKDVNRGLEWDDSTQTIEQIQARELSRQEAAVKRERAMAYAFSHQQLHTSSHCSSKASTTPQLGWNWLERWMAARPWENRHPSPVNICARAAAPPTPNSSIPQRQPSPLRRASAPTTPALLSFRQPGISRTASPARCTATVTPILGSFSAPATRLLSNPFSMSSHAHSLASSSMRDDLSVASFSGTPSYMASTESARAKLRSQSTPKQRAGGTRSAVTSVHSDEVGTLQQQQPASKKRLSFANVDSSSARNFLSWRGSARNHSFEGYKTKSKF